MLSACGGGIGGLNDEQQSATDKILEQIYSTCDGEHFFARARIGGNTEYKSPKVTVTEKLALTPADEANGVEWKMRAVSIVELGRTQEDMYDPNSYGPWRNGKPVKYPIKKVGAEIQYSPPLPRHPGGYAQPAPCGDSDTNAVTTTKGNI